MHSLTISKGAVLDRIDNKKGYSKLNCQWLTKSEHGVKTGEDRRNA